jgi:outer membrane receptor protein involved in Fe transport
MMVLSAFPTIALAFALQQPIAASRVTITVVDPTGAAVAGAQIAVAGSDGAVAHGVSGTDGTFDTALSKPGPVSVTVSLAGFASSTAFADPERGPVRVVLRPSGINETIDVAAAAGRITTPASATVLDAETLASAPGLAVDDVLRSIPGFTLFRRSSSRVANPTTQGATLRGLAASGASRTLVLADGAPLNDPFGGWVYWDRLPAAALERVEVVRGGAADLYGSDAVGGVIRFDSARQRTARAILDGGSQGTARASGYGGARAGRWTVFGAAESFTTDGYVVVAPESRGPIDTEASSRHFSSYAGADAPLGDLHVTVRAGYFSEDRGNGTPFQINATINRQMSASASANGLGGVWTARAYATSQGYDQTFSAVLTGRAAERPTSAQRVDTTAGGGAFEWVRTWGRAALLVSASGRGVNAELLDQALPAVRPAERTPAEQRTGAVVAQTSIDLSAAVSLSAGVRGERWTSDRTNDAAPRQEVGFFEPRAAIAWRVNPALSVRAAFQPGYRAPTINELYRPFRVGNVLTHANAALSPEESDGIELSALVTTRHTSSRLTGFWTSLDDAIVNVTLASGATILRQRQNAGRVRAAGVEAESDLRAGPIAFLLSAAFIDSVFTDGTDLVGLRVPQVPRWQAAAGVRSGWSRGITWSAQWRFIGEQFDDDRNEFRLDRSSMADARIAWRIRRSIEAFGVVENVFDEEQDVGRTPIRTIGLPRTARAGVRFGFR